MNDVTRRLMLMVLVTVAVSQPNLVSTGGAGLLYCFAPGGAAGR